jgi:hypothetical protein
MVEDGSTTAIRAKLALKAKFPTCFNDAEFLGTEIFLLQT